LLEGQEGIPEGHHVLILGYDVLELVFQVRARLDGLPDNLSVAVELLSQVQQLLLYTLDFSLLDTLLILLVERSSAEFLYVVLNYQLPVSLLYLRLVVPRSEGFDIRQGLIILFFGSHVRNAHVIVMVIIDGQALLYY